MISEMTLTKVPFRYRTEERIQVDLHARPYPKGPQLPWMTKDPIPAWSSRTHSECPSRDLRSWCFEMHAWTWFEIGARRGRRGEWGRTRENKHTSSLQSPLRFCSPRPGWRGAWTKHGWRGRRRRRRESPTRSAWLRYWATDNNDDILKRTLNEFNWLIPPVCGLMSSLWFTSACSSERKGTKIATCMFIKTRSLTLDQLRRSRCCRGGRGGHRSSGRHGRA